MVILSDPVVTALLAEFNEALQQLERTAGDDARLKIIEQLCELSRDARFQIGPPEYAEPDQIREMADCFDTGVDRIRNLWRANPVPKDVVDYCKNITDRAKRCREGLPTAETIMAVSAVSCPGE